jgi:hypothetical protein
MSLNIPSSLSANDITQIESYYESTDSIIQDLENGQIPEGINADDLVLYVLSLTENAQFLDPDSLDYLWEDPDVINALQDLRTANYGTSEYELLLADISDFCDAAGFSAIGDIDNAIQDYTEKYGEPGSETTAQTTDELMNLLEVVGRFNPAFALLQIAWQLGPEIQELQEEIADKVDDTTDQIYEFINDIEDHDPEDPSDQAEVQAITQELSMLKEVNSAYMEISKLAIDILENIVETSSQEFQTIQRTISTIRSNIGG